MFRAGVEYYQDLLRPLVLGRKCILAPCVTDAMGWVRPLRMLGAQRPLVLEQGFRVGQTPQEKEAETHTIGQWAPDLMGAIRGYEATLRNLPPEVLAAIDGYDPDRGALVIPSTVLSVRTIAGRKCYGVRDPRWLDLDDKVVINEFWEAARVRHAPFQVISTSSDAKLDRAARELDKGHGTAWAGDASEGFNAAAAYLRWVRNGEDPKNAKMFFREHCKKVRVMPFLEGIPCSIHGFVFRDTVMALRPVEMVVLRKEEDPRLVYAGNATYWDPPVGRREEMRDVAVKVGETLRARYAYRGTFSVDGVMTESGFLPTELNPRWGDALWSMNRCIPDLPLAFLDMALREGQDLDYRPRELEALILGAVDAKRIGLGWTTTSVRKEGTEELFLVEYDGGYRFADGDEKHSATLSVGPSQLGSWVRFQRNYLALPGF